MPITVGDTLSPVYQGDTATWSLPLVNRDGSTRNLSGYTTANFALKLQLTTLPYTIIPLVGGTLGLDTVNNILSYAPLATETDAIGEYDLWIIETVSGAVRHNDPYDLVIKAAP